ncbi:DUF1330 domain-containing protein [Photobacterium sanctipauli]|uniref:DUF1330 domain-containing protein n=1 Tax=Photobacterium sanctipauli TaxID=1342794 RepID=A0A2T3NVJ8_9GAMM|nr:DUF1330 domain-containing protein [Photobacterium sanctipauli]PSW20249.1 DUF1330 domain-containing protein [Photobacterium sanctipauli]
MTAYLIVTYDIADAEHYAQYNPGLNHVTAQTIAKHGGELIVATNGGIQLNGHGVEMKVVIEFPNRDAALAWHDDPEYAEAKAIRMASTKNVNTMIVDKFVLPNAS